MSGYEAAGRRFRTESEYKAAKRDLKLIEEIKSKIHMEQPGEVISLCDALAEGKYRFESAIGSEFDDRIYELAEKYKSQGYTKNSRLPEGTRARKKAQKKQAKTSGINVKKSAGKKNSKENRRR
ncbi:MAG: SrtB family sortase, partial [Lachnospiraceae bacterium]|nr:SrtB family sortase [Lachnospiraceae bacterium]